MIVTTTLSRHMNTSCAREIIKCLVFTLNRMSKSWMCACIKMWGIRRSVVVDDDDTRRHTNRHAKRQKLKFMMRQQNDKFKVKKKMFASFLLFGSKLKTQRCRKIEFHFLHSTTENNFAIIHTFKLTATWNYRIKTKRKKKQRKTVVLWSLVSFRLATACTLTLTDDWREFVSISNGVSHDK